MRGSERALNPALHGRGLCVCVLLRRPHSRPCRRGGAAAAIPRASYTSGSRAGGALIPSDGGCAISRRSRLEEAKPVIQVHINN